MRPHAGDQRARQSDRAHKLGDRAHPPERAVAANSVNVEQLVAVAALRQPSRLKTVGRARVEHFSAGTLADHLFAHRDGGEQMPSRASARDDYFHRTAGRLPSASSAPSAAIAIMIAVPP